MKTRMLPKIVLLPAVAAALFAAAVWAQPPYGPPPPADTLALHPAYLKSLSDLRAAAWLIEHRPGEGVANQDEAVAQMAIRSAIRDIRTAAFDDGMDANYAPPPDPADGHRGRLHRADELLHDCYVRVSADPDANFAGGLRYRILEDLGNATHFTGLAEQALRGR